MQRITLNGSTLLKKVSFGLPNITRDYAKCMSNLHLYSMRTYGGVKIMAPHATSQICLMKKVGLHTSREVKNAHKDTQLNICGDGKTLTIINKHGQEDRFNATWLRDHCCCSICTEPQSGQRTFSPTDLDPHCTIKQVHTQGDNVIVKWNEDGHTGVFGLDFLAKSSYSKTVREQVTRDTIPLESTGHLPRIDYNTVTSSGEGLWRWMQALNEHGICIVEDVPPTVQVKQLAGQIGTIKETVFGQDYVVKKKADATDLSYTTKDLPIHMDVMCYEAVPGYILLLFREVDECVVGGESVFVDAWREAERLRRLYPDDFDVLGRVPATFAIQHDSREKPDYVKYRRPHFSVDRYTGHINGIFWNPFSLGTLCADEEDIQPYYEAYTKFAKMLATSDTQVVCRMKKGELLSINNGRYVHGRKAYEENGGQRVLEGCFLCGDSVKSQAQVYSNMYNAGKPVKHVLNQDAF